MSVIRAVDGQETGLSVQPVEKKNRLQTGQEYHLQSALVQASLLLKHQPTGQLKRTRPLTITKQVTCFHRPGRSEVRSLRTHVYCDSSPSLIDWPSLSVVGFVD